MPLTGYYSRLLGRGASQPTDQNAAPTISVWRAELWWEGLWSVIFWALGFLEKEAAGGPSCLHGQSPTHCLIDWTDECLPFWPSFKPSAPSNAWNSLFEPPLPIHAPVDGSEDAGGGNVLTMAELEDAARDGRLKVSLCYGRAGGRGDPALESFAKLNGLAGADPLVNGPEAWMSGGRLTEAQVAVGRKAAKRWLVVKPAIEKRATKLQADQLTSRLPMEQWLAVHVRRSDKLVQCPQNDIAVASLVEQIAARCANLGCLGAFVCSCDAALKRRLTSLLEAEPYGLLTATMADAALPKASERAPHLDHEETEARRNAEDVLVESLVMSRCGGLLCTWSHVSVGVIYLAAEGFKWFMFGDEVEGPAAAPPQRPSIFSASASAPSFRPIQTSIMCCVRSARWAPARRAKVG